MKGREDPNRGRKTRTFQSPQQSSSAHRGAVGESFPSCYGRKSFSELRETMAAVIDQSGATGPSGQPTESPKQPSSPVTSLG